MVKYQSLVVKRSGAGTFRTSRVFLRPRRNPRNVVTVVASALAILPLVRSPNTIGTGTQAVKHSLSEVEAVVEAISPSPWKHRIRAHGKGSAGLRRKPHAGATLREGMGATPMGPMRDANLCDVMEFHGVVRGGNSARTGVPRGLRHTSGGRLVTMIDLLVGRTCALSRQHRRHPRIAPRR